MNQSLPLIVEVTPKPRACENTRLQFLLCEIDRSSVIHLLMIGSKPAPHMQHKHNVNNDNNKLSKSADWRSGSMKPRSTNWMMAY